MTAVEWLCQQLEQTIGRSIMLVLESEIEQAKQMEKDANSNLADFLKWLGDNKWHRYKDGKWFTTTELPYMDAQPRRFYTEEEMVKKYENSLKSKD